MDIHELEKYILDYDNRRIVLKGAKVAINNKDERKMQIIGNINFYNIYKFKSHTHSKTVLIQTCSDTNIVRDKKLTNYAYYF